MKFPFLLTGLASFLGMLTGLVDQERHGLE
jgi:hypothetical protein